ncbi:MAG: DUF3419 family protein [Chlamydiales bacterium]
MERFYSRLSYSLGNEDWITEKKALKIQSSDQIICITASGDRPLNLLSTEVGNILSIDTNPIQNALFDLKRAAIKNLNYSDYISFLGLETQSPSNRLEIYSQIKDDLSPHSARFWNHQKQKISKGVLYQGLMEKRLRMISKILRLMSRKKIDKLFSFDDLDEQKAYLKTFWNHRLWKRVMRLILSPSMARLFFNDPGLYAYVDKNINIGIHLYTKFYDSLNRFLVKESLLLSLLFKGDIHKEMLPPYLNKMDFEKIKSQINKIAFETKDINFFLDKTEESSIDCFSCSDIASYIKKENFDSMMRGILRTSKPRGRFCIRQFLSNYQIPLDIASHFERDSLLEQQLEKEDRCFVYRFICGTVKK